MLRLSRFLVTTALTVGSVVFLTSRAIAQTPQAQAAAGTPRESPSDAAFLVAGIAPRASLAAQQSSGGSRGAEGFGIGFKIGPIFSSFNQANTSFSNNNGFEGGLFFGGNRTGTVGVMGDLLYAKKGSKNASGTTTVDLHYIEIPILLRVNVGSRSRSSISVYGLAGPVFDILLKGEQGNLDVKSNYESLDLGVLVGAGIEVTRFLVEGRYNIGMKNVLKGGGGTASDIKSRSFAVLFGLRFN